MSALNRTLRVETEPAYDVRVGAGCLGEVAEAVAKHGSFAVLTDERVAALHLARLGPLAGGPVFQTRPGEESKSFAELEEVLDFLVRAGLDRSSALVVLGGGVPGDLGGLAASLYMRGIGVYQCPTTLLAQVDSSVGGKTAVNLTAGKNLAGTLHQPRGVWADVETLATLSDEEYGSGLGEVAKTALVGGEEQLVRLEARAGELLARAPGALVDVVADCIAVKAAVVARDPHEAGERKALNLGHSFAHAIEHAAGYGRIPHGAAVAVGIGLALEYSRRCGLLEGPELVERVARLRSELRLPADLAELRRRSGSALGPPELVAAMRRDKKARGGRILLVLVRRPGELVLDAEAELGLLAELLGA